MKKTLLAGAIALFLFACKKDNNTGINLNGSWEYRGTTCYCPPPTDSSAYKPGNGTVYNFSATNYKYYLKHVLKKSGTYKLFKENVNGTELNRIVFDNDYNSEAKYIGLTGNKFSLGVAIGSAADAPVDYYEKE
ncbi:hypothetical protein PQ469_28545 [Mucilaginibacter sp. KACC 22773]|jgi:hypothetical protein|uniref:hypothetical protein n=1 Tax=Mucilaginibacter sp. KACC 22773 TaxID=3025671 RepID=UPI0023667A0E|nr:hypothetical protein [Mucilaginibacter sp. KACC 22773]WDF77841.1 hypothetical protein PQ469_28545 [Mucilaginibacter sp. KACC 22773]